MMHSSGSQDTDCHIARGSYIGTSNEILNLFNFPMPEQKLAAIQTYACAWYGSNLWDLYGDAAQKAFRSWKTTIKMAHGVPRQTRTYLVENLLCCGLPSVKQLLIRRFVQFVQNLLSTENPIISMLAHLSVITVQSTTGLNVKNIQDEFLSDPLTTNKRLFVTTNVKTPIDKQDNIELLNNLLHIRSSEQDEDCLLYTSPSPRDS